MKTLALYFRLSSEDSNDGESESIQNQRDLLQNYVRSSSEFTDWNVMEFQDDGCTGTNFDRPSVQKMLKLAGNTINCIIVKDFSRFGRNLIEVGNYLDQIFPFLGVRFIAVNENYDSNNYKGCTASLELGLKALVYEMYSRDISQKIRAVQETKFRKGEYLSALPPYGYMRSKTEKNKLVANPDTASTIRRIFNMEAEGKTPTQIAIIFNQQNRPTPLQWHKIYGTYDMRRWNVVGETSIWTHANVHRFITDKRYKGCR